ncbi:hypothetical protein BDR05DRAFT_948131 [Suillus weaverae]|nr:hypothetical protein BDR05DRAFT_948131 [Suillus weaverae]
MGTGVMLLDGMASKNLLDSVLVELPWYTELDAIWHANPSMAAKTHLSNPSIDHAAALYSLIQLHGAGPLIGAHNTPPPAAHLPGVPPVVHSYGDPPIDLQLHQVAPPPPAPSQLHLHGLNFPDIEIKDDFIPPSPCSLDDFPLGDTLNPLDGDNNNMMFDGTGTLNSPPQVVRKKQQLAASPSPSPHVPQPFEIPSKSLALFYDSCSVFGAQRLLSHVGQHKLPSDIAHSLPTPLLTTRNTSLSSDYHMSPTPQTSLPKSAGSLKKKAKSDIMQQIDLLDAKSEHQQDSKKHDWLRDTCEYEATQVALIHQCQQEDRDAEIHLCKVDIWVHEAHSHVLNKEAETLWLKIQFQQMMPAAKDLGSDV